jgi:predicted nucleic acid-binding protein
MRAVVPEIVDYEVRRELIRCGKVDSVTRLDLFVTHPTVLYLRMTTAAIRLAAELWAEARKQGKPTADPRALDVDVILAAQAMSAGFGPGDFVVATANVKHLARFVAAEVWSKI